MTVPYKSRLPRIAAKLDDYVDAGVRDVADDIARDARGRVPVASGDLRDAIHVEDVEGVAGQYRVLAGDDDVFYGHLVEFGTSHTAPRPFLLPAAEGRRASIGVRVAARLRRL